MHAGFGQATPSVWVWAVRASVGAEALVITSVRSSKPSMHLRVTATLPQAAKVVDIARQMSSGAVTVSIGHGGACDCVSKQPVLAATVHTCTHTSFQLKDALVLSAGAEGVVWEHAVASGSSAASLAALAEADTVQFVSVCTSGAAWEVAAFRIEVIMNANAE